MTARSSLVSFLTFVLRVAVHKTVAFLNIVTFSNGRGKLELRLSICTRLWRSVPFKVEIEMANVAEWMRQNRRSLNAKKSEFMVIRHSRKHNNLEELNEIEVSQEKIGRVTKTKYLGLNIDENLSWNDQYKKVKAKVKSGLSALQRLKDILPQSKLAAVYRALIESHLRYGKIIWGCISDTKLYNLQTLQSRAKN